MFVGTKTRNSLACICIDKHIDTLFRNQFSNKDPVTVQAKLSNSSGKTNLIIFVSAYVPSELDKKKIAYKPGTF